MNRNEDEFAQGLRPRGDVPRRRLPHGMAGLATIGVAPLTYAAVTAGV